MSIQAVKSWSESIATASKVFLCQNNTYFLKPVTHLAYLTKSIVVNGMPEEAKSFVLNEDACDERAKEQFNLMFTQIRACNSNGMWTIPSSTHIPLITNIINKSIQYNGSFTRGGGLNLITNFRSGFGSLCHLNDCSLLQFSGKVSKLYLSESPLLNVASPDEILNTANVPMEWKEVYRPTFHLVEQDITPHSLYPVPLSYPILLVSFNFRIKQAINRALMNALAVGASMAAIVNNIPHENVLTGSVPDALETPYTLKAIAFDGRSISTIIVQINTLNLSNGDGVKNLIWFQTPETVCEFKPVYMLHTPNKMSHIKRRFIKRQTYANIDEDFQFDPIVNLMKFIHF